MSITTLSFLIFIFLVFAVYYIIPKSKQWVVLLIASIAFYFSFGFYNFIYVLITATTVYFATVWMQNKINVQKAYIRENKGIISKEDKKLYKNKIKKYRRKILIATIVINIGLLCVFKYFHFALEQINGLISIFNGQQIDDIFNLIAPLGISFYTFQSIGYLTDVYWENCDAERNYFKVLLFVTFFPQMTQGPISDFEQLSSELFSSHKFTYKNFSWGFQRMIWGFFKKMVIADTLSPYVKDVFANYSSYSGITTLIGAFMYSVQIYADFSGYMDIMCGFCETLGIRLRENFDRPYFSKSIAEYWRRWHISLGDWFKKYIYYPIGMSNWSRKIAYNIKEKHGKRLSDTIPATIALVVVWLATGLWHGASWAYIVWGLVNGLFIILTLWLDPLYDKCKKLLNIKEDKWAWRAFQTIRTFILVTFIKVLPEVGTLSDGFGLWKQVFTNFTLPNSIHNLLPFLDFSVSTTVITFGLAIIGTICLFFVSLKQRKGAFRGYFNNIPTVFRVLILAVVMLTIASFGVQSTWGSGGFLYANF